MNKHLEFKKSIRNEILKHRPNSKETQKKVKLFNDIEETKNSIKGYSIARNNNNYKEIDKKLDTLTSKYKKLIKKI